MPIDFQHRLKTYRTALSIYVKYTWTILREKGPSQVQFWLIALIIGCCGGLVAILFRFGIEFLQAWIYQTDNVLYLHSHAKSLAWYWILAVPIMGGFLIGIITHYFTSDGRVRSVADVIEGASLHNGRIEVRAGLASGLASLITLCMGGSTGREGPVVHMAAVISSKISNLIDANGITGRDLMGCAVAAGVSASFNAPIAGAIFALEVILRHFALHALTPIVIASITGTVIAHLALGDITEFTLREMTMLSFYAELPAFFIMGLVCGFVAVIMMRAIFMADDLGNKIQAITGIKRWMRPVISGAMLGAMAIYFPHIIGVGYETTVAALGGDFMFWTATGIVATKVIAVAITIAGRMGGGIFSPSLMVGALTGLAFGIVATSLLPNYSGGVTIYALAGMGAVAAAVLGAPLSTILIVFELTDDWQTSLAVMTAVAASTALASNIVDKSYFLTQLERRNIHLAAGPQAYLLSTFSVLSLMRPHGADTAASTEQCLGLIEQGIYLERTATLETAMPMFEKNNVAFIPIITKTTTEQPPQICGSLFQVDALKAYNRALSETAAEEHS